MTRRIAIAAAALALTLGGLPLVAQQGPGGPMGVFPGLNEVGLTDAQRDQVRGILEQERQTGADPGLKVRDAEAALHAALLADVADPQAIETAKAQLNAAHAAELDRRIDLMQKIAALLTPAQRQQLAQLPLPPGPRGRGAGGAGGLKP